MEDVTWDTLWLLFLVVGGVTASRPCLKPESAPSAPARRFGTLFQTGQES